MTVGPWIATSTAVVVAHGSFSARSRSSGSISWSVLTSIPSRRQLEPSSWCWSSSLTASTPASTSVRIWGMVDRRLASVSGPSYRARTKTGVPTAPRLVGSLTTRVYGIDALVFLLVWEVVGITAGASGSASRVGGASRRGSTGVPRSALSWGSTLVRYGAESGVSNARLRRADMLRTLTASLTLKTTDNVIP